MTYLPLTGPAFTGWREIHGGHTAVPGAEEWADQAETFWRESCDQGKICMCPLVGLPPVTHRHRKDGGIVLRCSYCGRLFVIWGLSCQCGGHN